MTCQEKSAICNTGLDGLRITGILVQLLREAFQPGNVLSPRLEGCKWVPKEDSPLIEDPTKSTILIESVYRWDPRVIGQRPGILVRRSEQSLARIGLGADKLQTFGLQSLTTPVGGGDIHATPVQGSHMVFCIAREAGTVEVLATEVYRFLHQFAPVFEKEFSFLKFHVAQIGSIAQLQESDEHFAVPIQVVYAYFEQWKLIQVAPKLATVSLQMET